MDIRSITYPAAWCDSLKNIVNFLITKQVRVKVRSKFGDTQTGYISLTTGQVRMPIVLYDRRSQGGQLMFNSVVQVSSSRKKGKVYWDIERDEPVLWVHSQ